jgi:hypothetical protein
MAGIHTPVRENQDAVTLLNRIGGTLAERLDRASQTVLPFKNREQGGQSHGPEISDADMAYLF